MLPAASSISPGDASPNEQGDHGASIDLLPNLPHQGSRAEWLARRRDHNRADALLIGCYGVHVLRAEGTEAA
jgi:hypothetical protein